MPSLPQDEEREIAEGSREDQSEYVLPTELPLLDAVQTLVDKERQLMELKVAEAAHEANAWRARCEALEASSVARQADAKPKDNDRGNASATTGRHVNEMGGEPSTWNSLAQNVGGEVSHWELLHLSTQAPGVRAVLSQLVTVDCSHMGLEAEGLDFLIRRLPRLQPSSSSSSTPLSKSGSGDSGSSAPLKLSLAHNAIHDSTPNAKALGQLLLRCPFSALDLGYNNLGPLCLLALAPPLAKAQQSLQTLILDGNWPLACAAGAGEQLGAALCDAAKYLPHLHALRVTLCDLAPNRASMPPTPAGATGATGTSSAPGGVSGPPAVRPSSSGTTMGKSKSSGSGSGKNGSNGSRSSSGGGGGGRLRGPMNAFGLLKQCGRNGFPKTLQDIALIGATLHKESIAELCARLKETSCTWTSLDLTHAMLGPVGVRDLALALAVQGQQAGVATPLIDPANPPLHMHAGSSSSSSNKGSSPPVNSGLVSLTLRHNGAASSGVQALCRALMPPPSSFVENGASSDNGTPTTKKKIKKGFHNCTLTRLDLASNAITDAGALELAHLFLPAERTGNRTLNYLDVSDNAVGVRGATKLLEAAQKCPTLLCVQGLALMGASAVPLSHIASARRNLIAKQLGAIKGAAIVTMPTLPQSSSSVLPQGDSNSRRAGTAPAVSKTDGLCHFAPVIAFRVPTRGAAFRQASLPLKEAKPGDAAIASSSSSSGSWLVFEGELARSDRGCFLWQITRHSSSSSGTTANNEGREVQREVLRCGTSSDLSGWDARRGVYRLRTMLSIAACLGDYNHQDPGVAAPPVLSLDLCAVDPDFMPFSKAKAAQLRGADGLVPTLEARGFQCRWALHEVDHDERPDAATLSRASSMGSGSTRPLLEFNQSSSSWLYADPRSASDLRYPLARSGGTRSSVWLQGRHRGVLGGDENNESDDGGHGQTNSFSAGWGKETGAKLGSSGSDVDDDRRYLVSLMRAEHAARGGDEGGESCEPDLAAAATYAGLVCLRRLLVAHAGTHTASQLRLELRCSPSNGCSSSDVSAMYLFVLATNGGSNSPNSSSSNDRTRSGAGGRRLVGASILCFEDRSPIVVAPGLGNRGGVGSDGFDETQMGSPRIVKVVTGTLGSWQSLDCAPLLSLEAGEVLSLWALPWPSARALLLAAASSGQGNGDGGDVSKGLADTVEALGTVVGSKALCVEARQVQLSRSEHVASNQPISNHSHRLPLDTRPFEANCRDPEGAVLTAARAAAKMPAALTFASTTPMHYAHTGANWL